MSREVERRKPHTFDALDYAYPAPPAPAITRDDFGRAFAVLGAAQPQRPLPPATVELYYRALSGYAATDFVAGVRMAVDTCEQWPTIPVLRRLCDEARLRRREREGLANVSGQTVSAERAALIVELHEAEAEVCRAIHGQAPKVAQAAFARHARAISALKIGGKK